MNINYISKQRNFRIGIALLSTSLLAGCGGGGDGGNEDINPNPMIPNPTQPTNNAPPTITSQPNDKAIEEQPYQYQITASDPEGQTLKYKLTQAPAGMTISSTGRIDWTPASENVGNHLISLAVSDNEAFIQPVIQSFTLNVANANNDAPKINISSTLPKAIQGQQFTYSVMATDPDPSDTLTYELIKSGPGMTIDPTTGVITWNVPQKAVGHQFFKVRVKDAGSLFDEQTLAAIAVIPQAGWTVINKSTISEDPKLNGVAENAFDNNNSTAWHTSRSSDPGLEGKTIELDLGAQFDISGYVYTPFQGANVEGVITNFKVYISADGKNWAEPVSTVRFEPTIDEKYRKELDEPYNLSTGQFVRIEALKEAAANSFVSIAEFNLVGSKATNLPPTVRINTPTETVTTISVNDSIDFSGTANDPEDGTNLSFNWNFANAGITEKAVLDPAPVKFTKAGTYQVRFNAKDSQGRGANVASTHIVRVLNVGDSLIPRNGWTVTADSIEHEAEHGYVENVIDNNFNTLWHSQWFFDAPSFPHEVVIDMGKSNNITGFLYLPRQDGTNGRIGDFEILASNDGVNWTSMATGRWLNSPAEELVKFNAPMVARFVKLLAKSEVIGQPFAAISEINLLGSP